MAQDVDVQRLWSQLLAAGLQQPGRSSSTADAMSIDVESGVYVDTHRLQLSRCNQTDSYMSNASGALELAHVLLTTCPWTPRLQVVQYPTSLSHCCKLQCMDWKVNERRQLQSNFMSSCVSAGYVNAKDVYTRVPICCADAAAMAPTFLRLPGHSRSAVQLLPPAADRSSPLTAVDLARTAEVSCPSSLLSRLHCTAPHEKALRPTLQCVVWAVAL